MNYQMTFKSKLLDASAYSSQKCKVCHIFMAAVCILFSLNSNVYANDSDGDGLSDELEISIGSEAYLSDTDGDGVADGLEVGGNHSAPLDTDSDSIFDVLDYDDDNDGLPTYLESKKDTDKDGILDYLDRDSDNDGIIDGEEAGVLNKDENYDGVDDAFDSQRIGAVDNNGDGIDDNFKLPDHNKDGLPDYLDVNFQFQLKKANDPILVENKKPQEKTTEQVKVDDKKAENTVEAKIDTETVSVANKEVTVTVAKVSKEKPVEKETKTEVHKIDKLADTKNVDSVQKVIDEMNNNEQSLTVTSVTPKVSTDQVKKEQPNTKDVTEVKQQATQEELVINRRTDTDNDGLSNLLEKRLGTNHLKRDSDGDNVSDAIEIGLDVNSPQDSDRDGIIDALDEDDDNDGVLTKYEDLNKDSTAINDDTDNDGVPNYLDANDDGDDKLTRDESYTLDSDKDGIPNYLDKNDGFKDPVLASMKKKPEIDPNKEPEIVVLFDGNAAELSADYEEDLVDSTDEDTSEDIVAEKIEVDDPINLALAKATIESKRAKLKELNQDKAKAEKESLVETKTASTQSTSRKKPNKSAWDLF